MQADQPRRGPGRKAAGHAVVEQAALQVELLEAGEAREGGEGGVVEALAVAAAVEQVERG